MNYVISFFYLAGKYDYQYVERQREGEKDEDGFSSRSGQRTMNKDIIKEEVVMAQGTLYLLQISFQPLILSVFFLLRRIISSWLLCLPLLIPAAPQPAWWGTRSQPYCLPHVSFSLPLGVFNVQFEDDSGRSWAGLVQYSISALLCTSPPNKRVSVSCVTYQNPLIRTKWKEETPVNTMKLLLSQGLHYICFFLQADSRLVIYDSLDCRNYQVPSQPVTGSGAVRTFFCISRGIVQVTCRLESFMDLLQVRELHPIHRLTWQRKS